MRIAVPLPGTMWAFDVISIIQIFDDDSVMYGSSDRPVIDFIANASSKALDHGMSIATTALRDYHEKPDLIIIPGFANPHEIATDRRTGNAKAWLFTADPADALAIRDWLVASHREGVEIAAMCTGVFALAWTGLLDGVECTTHLPFLDDLAAQFPKALVQKDRLLTHNAKQRIWTSAGGSICLDLCIALLAEHAGQSLATAEANMLMRQGDQCCDRRFRRDAGAGRQGGRDAVGLPAGGWLDRRSGCCLRQHHDQRRGICGNERLPCTGRTVMKF